MKKRILLLAGLLVLCIAGQILLRPALGYDAARDKLSIEAEPGDTNTVDPNNLFGSGWRSRRGENPPNPFIGPLLTMIAFVGLIGAGVWVFCKKFGGNWAAGKGKNIHITETVSLGPRKLIHIIQVGSKKYLLGSTPENIRMLTEITGDLDESDE